MTRDLSPAMQAFTELKGQLDNRRRANVLNALERVINTKILSLVAFGPLHCQVDSFELGNGHVYRPWPGPSPKPGEKMSPALSRQMGDNRFEYHADIDVAELVDGMSPGQLLLALDRLITEDMALIALSTGSWLACYPMSGEYPERDEIQPFEGRRPQRTGLGTLLTQEGSEQLSKIGRDYFSLENEERAVLLGAMEWIRLGLSSDALIVRFVCYWIAIERVSQWWNKALGLGKEDAEVLRLMRSIRNVEPSEEGIFIKKTGNWQRVFNRIKGMADQLNLTARNQIEAALDHVLSAQDAARLKRDLFDGDPSAKTLRDGIAHGDVDEVTVEPRSTIEGMAMTLEMDSRTFVFESIERLAGDAVVTPLEDERPTV